MTLPTKGEKYAELIEHLRKGQEAAAMLAHLHADESELMKHGYLAVSEMLNLVAFQVTKLATGERIKWN